MLDEVRSREEKILIGKRYGTNNRSKFEVVSGGTVLLEKSYGSVYIYIKKAMIFFERSYYQYSIRKHQLLKTLLQNPRFPLFEI